MQRVPDGGLPTATQIWVELADTLPDEGQASPRRVDPAWMLMLLLSPAGLDAPCRPHTPPLFSTPRYLQQPQNHGAGLQASRYVAACAYYLYRIPQFCSNGINALTHTVLVR